MSTRRRVALVAAVAFVLAACADDRDDTLPDLRGAGVEVLAVWEDTEQERFERVLAAFARATGAQVQYTSTAGDDIGAVLDARLRAGRPPDVAVLPQPGLLRGLAERGVLVAADDALVADVRDRYADIWRRLASVDGTLYGVWFKAANKSLVWYNVAAFEAAGVVPPDDIDGLVEVAGALSATGTPAFSVAGADGWTLTDLFENVYLRLAGADRYDALAEGRLPWTHPTVREALTLVGMLLAPDLVAGGPDAAQARVFPDAVGDVLRPRAAAAMIAEGDFVPGVVAAPDVELGVDVDVFAFPEVRGSGRMVVGGGDVAVLLRPTDAGRALLRFLASTEAASVWVSLGGFLSPNEEVDLRAYPDDLTRGIARALLEAGEDFRFDLSDLQPVSFGGTEDGGMRAILRDFLVDRDVGAASARLQAAAAVARG